MTIEVYQAGFRCVGEKHTLASAITINDFIASQSPDYCAEHPNSSHITATVNGRVVHEQEWQSTLIAPSDSAHIVLQPSDGGISLVAAVVAAVVATAAAFLLRPSIPNIGGRASQQGSSIYEVNAQGNRPKLGDVIPEQLGRHKVYPDILTSPVRRFVNQRSQEMQLLLSCGVGEFERELGELKIGSTPLAVLGGASFQFFEPGEDVTGHPAHENWYNAPEVGAATGSAGLRMRAANEGDADFTGLAFSGSNLLTVGGGYLPLAWQESIDLIVRLYQPVLIDANQFTIYGDFRHLRLGMPVSMLGDYEGDFTVRAITNDFIELDDLNGDPVNDLPPGNYNIAIDLTGAFYRILVRDEDNTQIRVQRYSSDETLDADWDTFPSLSNVTANIYPAGPLGALWTGPFLACPESEVTSILEVDVFCPRGLGILDGNGISYRERTIEIQYRDHGETNWVSIFRTIGGASRNALGWTFFESLSSAIVPEVRVRRLEEEDTSTESIDEIEWYGLRSRLVANTSYDNITALAITIRGSDLIASQTENQINLIQTRKVPRWDGSEWTAPTASRDISSAMRYIAHSAGYTDSDIAMDELLHLEDAHWTPRGETFDFVFNEPTTVKEAISTNLRAGMAELTTDRGRLLPVRDGIRTAPGAMYTPQNYVEGGELVVSVSAPRHDDIDGVDVEYMSGESWTTEPIKCRLPGDQGARVEQVRLDGVLNPITAWRIGMRERRRYKYQRWQYKFATEYDALNSKYLSYIVAAGDVPGFAQSAIINGVVVDGDNVHIDSSEPLNWSGGVEHVISWRRSDGSYSGAWPAQRGDDDYHVIAQIPPEEVPVIEPRMEPPHLLFGEGFKAIVRSIEPGDGSVEVVAENYDERIFASDDAFPD